MITGTLFGQVTNNVFAVGTPINDPGSSAQALDVATDVLAAYQATFLTRQATEYNLTGCDVTNMANKEQGAEVETSLNGGGGLTAASGVVAVRLNIRTGLRGRSFRGRTGIAGPTEADVAGNNLVAAARTSWQTLATTFFNNLAAASGTGYATLVVGVISTVTGGAPRVTPLFTPATGIDVPLGIGTRVSRMR